MTKKLSLLFFICVLRALSINAEVYEGSCGDNVKYSLDISTGVMKITGTGAMKSHPWDSYKSKIKTVEIADGVTSIYYEAFYSCSNLTSVTIPNSVTSIEAYAFAFSANLKDVYCYAEYLPIAGDRTFDNTYAYTIANATLHVPSVSISAYKVTSPWNKFGVIKSLSAEIDGIYYNFTWKNASVTNGDVRYIGNVNIPEIVSHNEVTYSVTTIEDNAFYYCTDLTSVTIPSSVTRIGKNAFYNCSNLMEVYCYAERLPTTETDAFNGVYYPEATLYVPEALVKTYSRTTPWSDFKNIIAIPVLKCAVPTIACSDNKLLFSCETEDVKYVYNFSTPSESDEDGKGINTPDKLQVSVYAKKDGYENSDVATKEIDLGTSGIRGDLNGDGVVNMPDAMFIVNKILNGKYPDEEYDKTGVRFGFYETIPGYSVKIDKVNMDGVSPYVMGSNAVGTILSRTSSQPTWDNANGSYSFVDLANSNDMFVRIDYTLTADDGSGEKIVVKDAEVTIPTQYIQWMPNYKYTYLIKVYDSNAFNWRDIPVSDLFPATFDAIVVTSEDGSQETITTITTR